MIPHRDQRQEKERRVTHAAQLWGEGLLCSLESPALEGRVWMGDVELVPIQGAGPDATFTHDAYQVPSHERLGRLHSYEIAGEPWTGRLRILPVSPKAE